MYVLYFSWKEILLMGVHVVCTVHPLGEVINVTFWSMGPGGALTWTLMGECSNTPLFFFLDLD